LIPATPDSDPNHRISLISCELILINNIWRR